MNIKIKNKEVELKFSFNSFKYMEEFDIEELSDIEKKPFKIISMVEILLLGALNHNPKIKISKEEISTFLEDYIIENPINVLMEELMLKLQESNFFKSLQKK